MREGLDKIISLDETIVAAATPQGRSAIGIVRISGPDAFRIAKRHFQSKSAVEHRRQILGTWKDLNGRTVDEVVSVFSLGPHSYTGEDVVEISTHGNPLIVNRVLEIIRDSGARLAHPGEFTLRAVANGKMDLMQAEAVRDFIDAQTEQQARTALRQIIGAGSRKIGPLKQDLVELIAYLEAGIDFAEDDVDVPDAASLAARITRLSGKLTELSETFGYGRVLMEGLRLVVLGKPNVGKSSLFNKLLSMDRAIVTEVPGTTRDVLTELLNLEGIPLRIMDTAGLRETADPVESIGVNKSLEMLADADLALVVLDGSENIDESDRAVLRHVTDLPKVLVVNKSDLPQVAMFDVIDGRPTVHVSAKTGAGIQDLRNAIHEFLTARKTHEDFVLTSTRQYDSVVQSIGSLNAALGAASQGVPPEMILLDLYAALGALRELTGEVVTEDILDRIFSTFCIGK
jgi:tRNA modification GTPase